MSGAEVHIRTEGTWYVQAREQITSACTTGPPVSKRRLSRRCSQSLHSNVWLEDKRQQSQIESKEVETRGNFFHLNDSQTVEQAPKEVVPSPFLEVFKTELDEALSNPIS